MKLATVSFVLFFALFLSLAALGIGAAADLPSTLMSRADYSMAKKAIGAEMRLAMARCRDVQGAERDVCKAEALAGERVKLADLQARYHGTFTSFEKAQQVRAKAAYDIASARCVSRAGDARVECLRAAREDQTRALAEAKPATT